MIYSFLSYHPFQVLHCMYKQCMDLFGWIHWVYMRVQSLDIQSVLLVDTWIIILKDDCLDFQNSPLMGLQMAT